MHYLGGRIKRRTIFGGAIVLVAVLIAVWLWTSNRADAPASARAEVITPDRGHDHALTAPASAPVSPSVALPFEIAEVWVEKKEVCQGESSRIKVTPHDRRGEEKWLRPNVNHQQAWDITFIPTLAQTGVQRIPITVMDDRLGRDMVETFASIDVKDCVVPYPMYVRFESVPPDDAYVAFATLVFSGPAWRTWLHGDSATRGPAPRVAPVRYRWDFGDGQTTTTSEPTPRHHYPSQEDRPDERITSYLVRVEALDAAGNTMATASTTVALYNTIRALAEDHATLQLVSTVPPGPAATAHDKSRTVTATLRNIDSSETARITGLLEKRVPCSGKDAEVRHLQPSAVLAGDTVAPLGSVTGTLTIPASELDGICSVAIEVEGKSTPGDLRVTGVFALDTGKREGQRLTREQAAVLATARERLGNPAVVSLADIHRLEDDGVIPKGVLTPETIVH
jgi:hypothetical protein